LSCEQIVAGHRRTFFPFSGLRDRKSPLANPR